MKNIAVISNGTAEKFTSLDAGAEHAAKIVRVLGPTTTRIRIHADLIKSSLPL